MRHLRERVLAISLMFALAAVFAGGSILTSLTSAQDATPVSGGEGAAPHPAHIHEGTCDNLNPQPLLPLADVQMRGGMELDTASPAASPSATMGGMSAGVPAAVSVTTVPAPLDTIINMTQHSINVHESAENIQNYIACGEIGGTPDSDGNLFVGLTEHNDSGYTGIAWLQANGEETIVTVFLAEGLSGAGDAATPEAASSPAA